MRLLVLTMIVLSLGAFEVSAASEYRILSECDGSANVRANISKDAPLEVHFAIAGAPTCYSVTTTIDGKQVRGYVLNADLDAVLAFERTRRKVSRDTYEAPPALPQPSPQIANPDVNAAAGVKPAGTEKSATAATPATAEKPDAGEKSAPAEKPVTKAPKSRGPLPPLR